MPNYLWEITDYGIENYHDDTRQHFAITWDYLNGGTNAWDWCYECGWTMTDASTGNSTSDGSTSYSGFITLWSAANQPGTTTWTNWCTSVANPNDPDYNRTNVWVSDTNAPPPSFAWQKANYTWADTGTNYGYDANGNMISSNYWNNTLSETITTTVELFTGGYPGSADPCVATVYAWALDLTTYTYVDPTQIQIKGTNLNADGSLTMQLTQNSYHNVTPVFPTNYSNVVFGVWADDPPFAINMTVGGNTNNIAGTNVTVIVGQPINLSLSGLDGMSNSVITWTMPSSNVIVGGYAPTAQLGQPIPFTNIHSADITFYFNDGPGPFAVSCRATGMVGTATVDMTSTATFNVLRPAARLRAVNVNPFIITNASGSLVVSLGQNQFNLVGMVFQADNLVMPVASDQGTWEFIQVSPSRTIQFNNAADGKGITISSSGLDGSVPLMASITVTNNTGAVIGFQVNDSPATELDGRTVVWRDQDYDVYLTWTSSLPGSIRAPIRKVSWKLSVAVVNDGANPPKFVTPHRPNAPQLNQPIIGVDWRTYPVWNGTIQSNLQTNVGFAFPVPPN
ncbi:MAG: hypothetical protein HY300_16855 [Verrucomicrobia bacterium]|nr:hypothetical protein [Verrucomicrobiota bacterium]